jgi:hypothetical protein
MNRLLLSICLLIAAGAANATLIPFQFNGGSLSATGAIALSGYSANSGSASLDDGGSASFTFGTVSVLGGGIGNLTLGVNFVSPINGTQGVTGPYSVFAVVLYNEGHFSGGSTDFAYNYLGNVGTGRLTVNPIDARCFFCYPSFTFSGSITNLGSRATQVPEPGTLALLGSGLLALGMIRRHRFVKAG